jgi:hypothetical protein
MANLTIGGCTIHLGDHIERAAQSVALPALLMASEQWLNLARHVLPAGHATLIAMQELVDELKRHLREGQ